MHEFLLYFYFSLRSNRKYSTIHPTERDLVVFIIYSDIKCSHIFFAEETFNNQMSNIRHLTNRKQNKNDQLNTIMCNFVSKIYSTHYLEYPRGALFKAQFCFIEPLKLSFLGKLSWKPPFYSL